MKRFLLATMALATVMSVSAGNDTKSHKSLVAILRNGTQLNTTNSHHRNLTDGIHS